MGGGSSKVTVDKVINFTAKAVVNEILQKTNSSKNEVNLIINANEIKMKDLKITQNAFISMTKLSNFNLDQKSLGDIGNQVVNSIEHELGGFSTNVQRDEMSLSVQEIVKAHVEVKHVTQETVESAQKANITLNAKGLVDLGHVEVGQTSKLLYKSMKNNIISNGVGGKIMDVFANAMKTKDAGVLGFISTFAKQIGVTTRTLIIAISVIVVVLCSIFVMGVSGMFSSSQIVYSPGMGYLDEEKGKGKANVKERKGGKSKNSKGKGEEDTLSTDANEPYSLLNTVKSNLGSVILV